MNRVAVILPVCKNDNVHFLRKSIESILNQDFSNFDLIITLDGEIDIEKENLIREFKQDKIIIHRHIINRGLAAVLNDSINYCILKNYEYIARMDSDDISSKKRLSEQISYLDDNPQYDVLGTNATVINENGERIGYKKLPQFITIVQFFWRCNIIHPSVIFRTCFFLKYGIYNLNYRKSQDYELWLRATKMGAQLANLNKNLFYLRYENAIVKRRKDEQKYNIQLKIKYLPLYIKFFSIIPNIAIIIMPSIILKYFSEKILIKNDCN